MTDWLGKTIGKVRIDKYLARGGMAEVYLGTHLTLDRPVAIKVLHSYIEQDPDLLVRFQREAKVVAGLRHPNIVQIYDFDAIDGHPYIVMEYLKGPPLATYLRGLHKRNERIPHHQVARLLKALTASLDYAHDQDVIHRDIKPGNILLHGKADEITLDKPLANDVEAVLTDFGLVRIANTASQTASGMVSGTPAYMSPEQARGDQTDRRTDIYSLGIVLYEMLAGRVPFEADSTLSVIYKQINDPPPPIPGISPAVQKVIDRALAKNPEGRYPTARNMAVDFFLAIGMTAEAETIVNVLPEETKTIIGDLPDAPPKSASTFVRPKPGGRKPTRIGIGILSVIGLLALAIGAFLVFFKSSISSNAADVQNPESVVPTAYITSSESSGLSDANGMAEIATGTYEVGTTPADEYHSAPMNILLNGFWIDKHQTTYVQYQQFLIATGAQSPDVVGEGNQPVRGVTWDQAVAYCSWVNKRLPTEAEWEAAGRGSGPNPQLYPWGNDPTADGNVGNLPDQDTYEVGTLLFNKSPYDVYDMVGNIWEWVGEPYANTPTGSKILRGGRFGLPILELSYRLAVASDDTRYVKFAGFRCAADQIK
jgi:serine/threonine protein kinase